MALDCVCESGKEGKIKITVPGAPIVRKPARFIVEDGHGRVVPAGQLRELRRVRRAIREQYQKEPLAGACQVHMVFGFGPGDGEKPAVDDLVAFYMMALGCVVLAEEAMVLSVFGEVGTSRHPGTDVWIHPVEVPVQTS